LAQNPLPEAFQRALTTVAPTRCGMLKRTAFAVILALSSGILPGAAKALYASHPGVVTANPADHTPHVLNGKVTTILPLGERIVVGGTFTEVQEAGAGKPVLARGGLFAFDATTGTIDPDFTPQFAVDPDPIADKAVEALAAAPDGGIFVGGTANYLGGATDKLVKLNAATGALAAAFRVAVNSGVKDIAVSGSRLYLAGTFDEVNRQPRGGLAAVDSATGTLDSDVNVAFTQPRLGVAPRVETIAVTPDGSTLVAGGNFMVAGGQSRPQLAVLDVAARPARLADWHSTRFDAQCSETGFDSHIRDIDISPDGSYFVVVTTGGYNRAALCDAASRWETGARGRNLDPTWIDRDGGDSFTAVSISGSAVYVGGHFRWLNNNRPNGTSEQAAPGPGAVPREGIAALDPLSGLPLSWNPGRARGEGAWALVSTPTGLYVGSDTDLIAGETHQKLAFFPLAGGVLDPGMTVASAASDLYTISPAGHVFRHSFDGRTVRAGRLLRGGAEWTQVTSAFAVGNRVYTTMADGTMQVRSIGNGGIGTPQSVELYGMPESQFPMKRVTGMFYDNGRLYHTVRGDSRLFWRGFAPESGIFGYEVFVADEGDRIDFGSIRGMTLVNHRLAYVKDGVLWSTAFVGGRPVPGTESVVGNSATFNWTSRGLFALPGTSAVRALEPHPRAESGAGYWMARTDGSVLNFGAAEARGSLSGTKLKQPIAGMAATPTGQGYWLVAADGGIFSFGDATFHGSTGAIKLNRPIVAMAATPTGQGYWLVAADGGIFSFGEAPFAGSADGPPAGASVVGLQTVS
jgi:hypothetical protein